jgi:hypothetical protein
MIVGSKVGIKSDLWLHFSGMGFRFVGLHEDSLLTLTILLDMYGNITGIATSW